MHILSRNKVMWIWHFSNNQDCLHYMRIVYMTMMSTLPDVTFLLLLRFANPFCKEWWLRAIWWSSHNALKFHKFATSALMFCALRSNPWNRQLTFSLLHGNGRVMNWELDVSGSLSSLLMTSGTRQFNTSVFCASVSEVDLASAALRLFSFCSYKEEWVDVKEECNKNKQ